MQAVISSRQLLPPDFMYLELSVSPSVSFLAGQFFRLTLPDLPRTDSRGNSRFFGFVNSPLDNQKACLLTRTGTSAFKSYLAVAPLGTAAEIGDISGNMTLPPDNTQPLVLITSGVGIAPFLSLLAFVQEKSLPRQITLCYSPPHILYDRLTKFTWLKITNVPPPPENHLFYITGIPQFVTSAVKSLHNSGVAPNRIRFEIFTGY